MAIQLTVSVPALQLWFANIFDQRTLIIVQKLFFVKQIWNFTVNFSMETHVQKPKSCYPKNRILLLLPNVDTFFGGDANFYYNFQTIAVGKFCIIWLKIHLKLSAYQINSPNMLSLLSQLLPLLKLINATTDNSSLSLMLLNKMLFAITIVKITSLKLVTRANLVNKYKKYEWTFLFLLEQKIYNIIVYKI